MEASTYIVSGFLGAGKTTLIRKLLKEAFAGKRTVLIENDFGEVSMDAALMRASGVEVKEINSGCICCSLSGDFALALKEVTERFSPEVIIIEPSGVGKLSDIIKACKAKSLGSKVKFKTAITVSDAKRCEMYYENFGEFFKDQIENADVILLSHTDIEQKKLDAAFKLVKELNPHAEVFIDSWDKIHSNEILNCKKQKICKDSHCHVCGEEHSSCGHDHSQSASEAFDTVTIETDRCFTAKELEGCIRKAEQSVYGILLRAKGIVRCAGGHLDMQYISGDLKISPSLAAGKALCFIGRNLSVKDLSAAFERT